MNRYYAAAGIIAILVGLIHSVLGERLIFVRMRKAGLVPTVGSPRLEERHVRILWASWHVLTVLGWGIGAILVWLSLPSSSAVPREFLVQAIVAAMLGGSLLVAVGTKGRHPGWIGLLAVAVLAALG
ncbi:MAG: hypothetical protein ABI661_05625 [Gammaproteobacteria bacterium]